MLVKVNGEIEHIDKTTNIAMFLSNHLNGKISNGIAIAKNGVIILRSKWEETQIMENDELEIVHAVQGG